jgi:hypothetical protein
VYTNICIDNIVCIKWKGIGSHPQEEEEARSKKQEQRAKEQ